MQFLTVPSSVVSTGDASINVVSLVRVGKAELRLRRLWVDTKLVPTNNMQKKMARILLFGGENLENMGI